MASGLALPLATALPSAAPAAGAERRVLLLIELGGGNDGLNTLVPYADAAYGRLRPRLAVPHDQVLQLDARLGLHPRLEPLMASWRAGDLAFTLNVGYPRPNRSHFRSIEIWNSASDSAEVRQDGWLARLFAEQGAAAGHLREGLIADGLVLGGTAGPLAGPGLKSLTLQDPDRFLRQAAGLPVGPAASANPALAHILKTRGEIHAAASEIETHLARAGAPPADFPQSAIGRQLALAAHLVRAGLPVAVLKAAQGGYDTHAGQAGRHPRLLGELAAALAALRRALEASGDWDRVLVMSYAEFGRRAAENASGGTDHGTAAPHLLMGGRVKGGLYGAPPDLARLEAGDIVHSLDFRRLYATAAEGWWGLPPSREALKGAKPLPGLL